MQSLLMSCSDVQRQCHLGALRSQRIGCSPHHSLLCHVVVGLVGFYPAGRNGVIPVQCSAFSTATRLPLQKECFARLQSFDSKMDGLPKKCSKSWRACDCARLPLLNKLWAQKQVVLTLWGQSCRRSTGTVAAEGSQRLTID